MSGDSMTLKNIKKVNFKFKFLNRKSKILNLRLRGLICSNTIQLLFWLWFFYTVPKYIKPASKCNIWVMCQYYVVWICEYAYRNETFKSSIEFWQTKKIFFWNHSTLLKHKYRFIINFIILLLPGYGTKNSET